MKLKLSLILQTWLYKPYYLTVRSSVEIVTSRSCALVIATPNNTLKSFYDNIQVMNYSRIFLAAVLVASGILFSSKPVTASEGTAFLTGSQTDAECFAASVLTAPAEYRILITCRNLTTPPQAETLFYIAWAKKIGAEADSQNTLPKFGRGAYIFLGDIGSGKLSARAREPFGEVIITAQKESSPSAPDLNSLVVSGTIQPIEFGEAAKAVLNPTPTAPVSRVTLASTRNAQPPAATAGRSVVSTAFRLFLVIIGIIVIAAVAISVIQRRSAAK